MRAASRNRRPGARARLGMPERAPLRLLAATLLLLGLHGSPRAGTLSAMRGSEPDPGRLRVCILPLFLQTAETISGYEDLSPLLEAYLGEDARLELIPARRVREQVVGVDPWLGRAGWSGPGGPGGPESVETWFRLYERWTERVRVQVDADYYLEGRVVSTGRVRTVTLDLLRAALHRDVVFRSARSAAGEGDLPGVLGQMAGEIRGFLGGRWSHRYVEQVRRDYLARVVSLPEALRRIDAQVEAYPGDSYLRVFLLSMLLEDEEAHGARIVETAARTAQSLDPADTEAAGLFAELNVDPFLVLCRLHADRGEWEDVVEASRLGLEKHRLRSRDYGLWQARALRELGRYEEALRTVDRMLQESPGDPELARLRTSLDDLRRFRRSIDEPG